jgi:CcmD family protein
MKKFVFFLTFLCSLTFLGSAQITSQESDYTNTGVEMADAFRADGKIYVVVAIVLIIFAGLIFYTVNIDRKLSKLEKEFENQ